MEFRKLLCDICTAKIRRAEAKYKKQRRLIVKVASQQEAGKIKVTIKK